MMRVIYNTRYRNTVAGSFRRARQGSGKSRQAARSQAPGQVRIIAGRWRGRKLDVPDVIGLRPTGDRVRETLFNWLQGNVAGAHCLDLFAGSGALGFEALSRSAQSATFVEPDAVALRNLGRSCELLDVPTGDERVVTSASAEDTPAVACLYAGTAESAIGQWSQLEVQPRFDLVFIDPPFQMACQWEVLENLAPALLADNALVYIETPCAQAQPESLPESCEIVREKRFGDVVAHLLSYTIGR